MNKLVNGIVVACSAQETAAFEVEWAANAARTPATVVTMRKLQKALHVAGRLQALRTALAASSDEALKIDWATASTVSRDDAMVESARVLLGVGQPVIDAIFAQAVQL